MATYDIGVLLQGEPSTYGYDHRYFEPNGDQRWSVTIGTTGPIKSGWKNEPTTLEPVDHYFYLAGNDGAVRKINAVNGSVVWTTSWGDQGFRDIDVDPYGNVYVAGSKSSELGAPEFAKFNTNGGLIWEGTLGTWYPPGVVGGTLQQAEGRTITWDKDGNAYIGGQWASVEGTWSHGELDRVSYAKIGPNGELVWIKMSPDPQALFWSNTAVIEMRMSDNNQVLYLRHWNHTLYGYSTVCRVDPQNGNFRWTQDYPVVEGDSHLLIGRLDFEGNRYWHTTTEEHDETSLVRHNISGSRDWAKPTASSSYYFSLPHNNRTFPIVGLIDNFPATTGFYTSDGSRLAKYPYDFETTGDLIWRRVHEDPPEPEHPLGGGASIYRIAPDRVGNLLPKFAITTIAHSLIQSTNPYIPIIVIYGYDLTSTDHLHFSLKSTEETISTNNPENPEQRDRFGFSMDGGGTIVKFPAEGIPAVNAYNVVVYAKIEVAPRLRASLTPYCQVVEGAGSGKWWDIMSTDKETPNWVYLGLDEDEEPEYLFEHEVEGIEE